MGSKGTAGSSAYPLLETHRPARSDLITISQSGSRHNSRERPKYDTSGSVVLSETVTDIADGEDPTGNQQPSNPDGPELETFTVTDDTLNDNTEYTVDYEVSESDRLEEVRVTFENTEPGEGWATRTKTSDEAPTGTVTYSQGGTEGHAYEITVGVVNENGIVVDSGSIAHVAGSDGTVSFP
ncbi:hypothetical protein [Natronorubrum halalkaliphilum]|uniref:hypothetical protein n=1 Tax=Natronorubrum halalkaliphilum TaxID=2691917 RepID=UPI001915F1E0|nr:hypothetical protein [Natronorubrum halalkaliphilum]